MDFYREIGFVNTREIFAKALRDGYAVPAYNFVNMEQLQAIVQACLNTRSPVIIQISKNVRLYGSPEIIRNMARGAMELIRASGSPIPAALHLDHGDSVELCIRCI